MDGCDTEQSDIVNGDETPIINNAILSYMVLSMQSSSAEKIKSAVLGHFVLEYIINAKDKLWAVVKPDIIGRRKRRTDGTTRSEKEAHTQDIITALYQLDEADKTPDIVISALSLGSIPRSFPEELNHISLVDRLNQLEERFTCLSEVVDHTVSVNLTLREQMSIIQQDNSRSHAAVAGHERLNTGNNGSNPGIIPNGISVPRGNNIGAQSTQGNPNDNGDGKDNERGQSRDQEYHGGQSRGHHKGRDTSSQHISVNRSSTTMSTSNTSVEVANTHIDNRSNADDDFQIPAHAARKQRREDNRRVRIIQGSRSSGNFRGAPEPHRDAFIYRVLPDTTTDMMRDHIVDIGINIISLDCISNPNAKYKSFMLTTSISKFNDLFNADLWPEGIRVCKYIPPKRGEQ